MTQQQRYSEYAQDQIMNIAHTHITVPDQNMEPPEDEIEETEDEGLDADEQRDRDWDDAQDGDDDYVDYGEGY